MSSSRQLFLCSPDQPANAPGSVLRTPILFSWKYTPSACSVLVAFDINWERTYPLKKDGEKWFLTLHFLPCVLRYKFIVDGVWLFDMEQETVTEVDGTINNIVYIMENPVEKERWMNLKSENESLKVQLLQQRTYTPPANEEQAEVQKLLKLVERLKHENQEKQISIEQYQLELIESQNTNRKLKTEYASVQSRYQSSQQELQAEKLDSDKLKKEVEDLTKENLKFKNDAILFEKSMPKLSNCSI